MYSKSIIKPFYWTNQGLFYFDGYFGAALWCSVNLALHGDEFCRFCVVGTCSRHPAQGDAARRDIRLERLDWTQIFGDTFGNGNINSEFKLYRPESWVCIYMHICIYIYCRLYIVESLNTWNAGGPVFHLYRSFLLTSWTVHGDIELQCVWMEMVLYS